MRAVAAPLPRVAASGAVTCCMLFPRLVWFVAVREVVRRARGGAVPQTGCVEAAVLAVAAPLRFVPTPSVVACCRLSGWLITQCYVDYVPGP